MEMMNSAIVTLVLKMKEIVILIVNVKATNFVDPTIVQLLLVLTQKLIVVIMLLTATATAHLQHHVG